MAHPKETRDTLRRAYVFSTLSLELAAIQCGVSFATAGRWKKEARENGDDWDVIRSANMLASGAPEDVARSILASLMTQFQVTLEKVNTADDIPAQERVTLLASLTDGYSKAIAASKKILLETSQLATSMETMKLFSTFIQEHYPQHLTAFVEVLEAFGPVLEKNYG
ncbi:hypothetical protein SSYM_2246 [Serratia symbiotica str. Tucson]|uniref:DUF1804 family protein n=2 Tax=Serratia symbiotica TaxID=138074 RepID=E9CP22_9GAMM|nr:DUF1804 family protein [Serratia symbiotica]EFW11613.1 hypothetical protein SSYM_2246 [Serratia symbiotica str. Tucson]BBI91168.1 uncharacterized protein SSYIS1_02230 [Serratia symbiotica]